MCGRRARSSNTSSTTSGSARQANNLYGYFSCSSITSPINEAAPRTNIPKVGPLGKPPHVVTAGSPCPLHNRFTAVLVVDAR